MMKITQITTESLKASIKTNLIDKMIMKNERGPFYRLRKRPAEVSNQSNSFILIGGNINFKKINSFEKWQQNNETKNLE